MHMASEKARLGLFLAAPRRETMGFFAPREAKTTIPCPKCKEPLLVVRRCRSAHMACPRCRKEYPLEDYIQKADKAMEDFLDNCYIDRL